MSTYTVTDPRKVTTKRVQTMKQQGEKIAMITSYDYTMASLVDQAGIDMLLVGDSASNVMQGNATTIPITIDDMIVYGRTVVRAVKRAMVLVDMPFGTYQGDPMEAQRNAVRIMQETGADGVKLEGGQLMCQAIKMIMRAGIPVCGHLGLTPQSINQFGSFVTRATEDAEAQQLIEDAKALEAAGCFAVVLEKIPAALATRVTKMLHVPTIGIGAGGGTDGQVLVAHDMLGLNMSFKPKFLRIYNNLGEQIIDSVGNYINDVKNSDFPNENEQY
jgi:3-methyl-2-oxobutanoate hydroxymethyltransferase